MIYVDSISIIPKSVTVKEGQWYNDVSVVVCPTDATNKSVSWYSDRPDIASVNENGEICGVSPGETTIYASATDGSGVVRSCSVTVQAATKVTSVSIDSNEITVGVGARFQLFATVYPANADNTDVRWGSSDTSVASVDYYSGCVTTKAPGTAEIRATAADGSGKYGIRTVTVLSREVSSVSVYPQNVTLLPGDTMILSKTIAPDNAINKGVEWSSSNKSVAEVTSMGKVQAKSVGTAQITVKTREGGFTAVCNVHVINDGIVIDKDPFSDHNRIVFPNGKVWNCINFDIINDYQLDKNDPESQRFYDNLYEEKFFDETMDTTIYNKPYKTYTNEELKVIYMIDPHGMAAYVREYAGDLPNSNAEGVQDRLGETLEYKDDIFKMLFGRNPCYYARNTLGKWYETTDKSDLTNVVSESELLFGGHPIYDGKFWLEFFNIVLDIISYAVACPALRTSEKIARKILKGIKYYSLLRSVSKSALDEDFGGFISAIANGIVDEDQLEETILINDKINFKAANYTLGWAFQLLSFSSDLGVVADTLRSGPNFYKNVFNKCANDTSYGVYLRTTDDNLVAVSDIAAALD